MRQNVITLGLLQHYMRRPFSPGATMAMLALLLLGAHLLFIPRFHRQTVDALLVLVMAPLFALLGASSLADLHPPAALLHRLPTGALAAPPASGGAVVDGLVVPVGPSSTASRLSRRTGPGARPVRRAHGSLAAMTATGPGGAADPA